jgi:acetolactate synthase-1/2/3 large subunit
MIAIGMRFDDRVTGRLDKYAKQAKIIHLDIDPSEIDKNVQTTVPVWGDCKETLPALTAKIQQKSYPEWLQKFRDFEQKEIEAVINEELHPKSGELTMGEVIHQLNELTHGEAIIVTDVGQHQMVACRYAKLNKTRSNVTSGGLGTMGFALPAAIGAKFGAPDRTVVAVIGDGGFQITLQELGTIMQSNINVKILILNNRFLGMVRQWQELFNQHRYSFVDIESPDFVALAAAYRIKGKSENGKSENGKSKNGKSETQDIFVTGEHFIFDKETNKWIQVKDYKNATIQKDFIIDYFSCLITTNRRIPIDNELFWDWEDDELAMPPFIEVK